MSLRLSPAKVVGTIVVLCAALAGPSEARAAIAYGGPATVAFNPASYSVGFTTGGATSATTTVTAVLSGGPVSQAVGVSYTYTVPPALGGGVGYNVTGILNFPVGQTTASFNVTLYNPQSVGSQAITVQLSAVTGPASLGTPSTATINVVTSGPPATVQFSAATYCVQGGSSVPIVVTLANGPVAQDVSFSYASGGGTAVAGSDYLAVSGTGTIPAGQSSFSFSVTSINDPAGGSVNLNLTLSNLTGPATLGSPSTATLTINDVVISVAFSAATYTQAASTSGSTPATIAVNLTGGPVDEAVTFSYATVAGGSAVAGVDYTAVNGTGTIPAGQSSTAFSVLVMNNPAGGSATVDLQISNVAGPAVLGTPSAATLTITDVAVPAVVQFSMASYSVPSGSTATISVARTGYTGITSTVNFCAMGGTATPGSYSPTSGTLTFNPGDTSQSFTITTTTFAGADQSLNLALSSPSSGTQLGTLSTATLTILAYNLPSIQFSASTYVVNAATSSQATVCVTATLPAGALAPTQAATVNFQTCNGTAVAGTEAANGDYQAASGTLTFAPGDFNANGVATQTVSVTVFNHPNLVARRTVNLQLSNATNATVGSPASAVLTIQYTQGSVTVVIAPPTLPPPGTTNNPLSVSLTASVPTAPVAPAGLTVNEPPAWGWMVNNSAVQYSSVSASGPWTAPPSGFSLSPGTPTISTSPDTSTLPLTASFPQAGYWQVTACTQATYNDSPGPDTWVGTASVTFVFTVQYSFQLTSAQSVICAGGLPTAVHQTLLTATITDGLSGKAVKDVEVAFSTTQGTLSADEDETGGAGHARTTLTSGTLANVSAQVTASATISGSAYVASVAVPILPTVVQLTSSSGTVFVDQTAQLTVNLTFNNGIAVKGHTIAWRVSPHRDGSFANQTSTTDGGGVTTNSLMADHAGKAIVIAEDMTVLLAPNALLTQNARPVQNAHSDQHPTATLPEMMVAQARPQAISITGVNGEGTKKWIVATLPTPHQPPTPNVFSARQSVVNNGPAILRYQRGQQKRLRIPGKDGTVINLGFANGVLDHNLQLLDGPEDTPEMSLAGNRISISGVQQGDKIFVEDAQARVSDRVAVVKNLTWHDYKRNGSNLTFAAPFDTLPADLRDNIAKTIPFALDPSRNSAQSRQRQVLQALLALAYPGEGYCSLDIPSSLGVGTLPWDFDHGHLASSVPPGAAFVKKAAAFVDFEVETSKKLKIVGGIAVLPGKSLTGFWSEEDRTKYLDFLKAVEGRYATFLKEGWALTDPFIVYHTFEEEKYGYTGKLKDNDPIRQIRTNKGGNPHLYSSLGAKNDMGKVTNNWHDMPKTSEICNIQFIINKRQQLVLMPYGGGGIQAAPLTLERIKTGAVIFPKFFPDGIRPPFSPLAPVVALEASVMIADALED